MADISRVYCHHCDRSQRWFQGGLKCPECSSEFVEVIEPDSIPPHPPHGDITRSPPPIPQSLLHDHNSGTPIPDLEEGDITAFEFNIGQGRGRFFYSSRTYTFGSNTRERHLVADDVARNFEPMLANTMGGGPQSTRGLPTQSPPGAPLNLFSILFSTLQTPRQNISNSSLPNFLGLLMNPQNAQHGNAVLTQEVFDRVMTQLMGWNQTNGAPHASETAISTLEKKPVDKEMMGSDGKAECSICIDNVEIGDEVTFLPCNHWFHGNCVVSWLKEHDTCPHCRQAITNPDKTDRQSAQTSSRRRSRRISSIASPFAPPPDDESSRGFGSPPRPKSPKASTRLLDWLQKERWVTPG